MITGIFRRKLLKTRSVKSLIKEGLLQMFLIKLLVRMLILKRLDQLEFLKTKCLLKNQSESLNHQLDPQQLIQRSIIQSKILEKSSQMTNFICPWLKILTQKDLKSKHEKKSLQYLYIQKFQRQSSSQR